MAVWVQCSLSILILIGGFAWFMILGVRQAEMPEEIQNEPILSSVRAEWNEAQVLGLPCVFYVILWLLGVGLGLHAIYRFFTGV